MSELELLRKEKDEFFSDHPQSPIPHEDQHGFDGLSYFDENAVLDMELPLTPGDESEVIVGTSDGAQRVYQRAGTAEFELEGEAVTVTLLSTVGHPGFFVPFRDATSGKESYGAGRYLDLEYAVDGMVKIDFNLAYNPYCAYNDAYSCPLPPYENWLTVPIPAGERDYKSDAVSSPAVRGAS